MNPAQIAAQLYTCRDLLKTSAEIAKTLHRVRGIGYTAVQVSGMGPIPEDELGRILDGEGLECCATHEPSDLILSEPQRVAERLAKLGCRYTAYPFPHGVDLSSEDAVGSLIAKLDRAGAVLSGAGVALCYHNHHQEFRKIGDRTILEHIYDRTNPRYLQAEPDTYWIQYGGGDPVAWCEKLSGRMPLIHLKDFRIDAADNIAMCEIGAGNLDFVRIVSAAEKSGCRWFIVEQDTCPGDPVDSLAESYRYLASQICAI